MATYQEQLDCIRREKEDKKRADEMSKDQTKNWRIVLESMGVPFVSSLSDEAINELRKILQTHMEKP